jgi:hypothetical protein
LHLVIVKKWIEAARTALFDSRAYPAKHSDLSTAGSGVGQSVIFVDTVQA